MSEADNINIEDIAEGRASGEDVAAYNQQSKARLQERADGRFADISEERQEAIDALRGADDGDTAEIELGERALTVKTYTDEWFETRFRELNRDRDDPEAQSQVLPELVAWMVEAPDEYTDPSLWRDYAREFGRDELALVLFRVLEPKVERAESADVIQRFRERFDRDTAPQG